MPQSKEYIEDIIVAKDGNITEIAKDLGIPKTTCYDLLKRLELMDLVNSIRDKSSEKINFDENFFLEDEEQLALLHKELCKINPPSLIELANKFECAPKKIEEKLEELKFRGYKVTEPDSRGRVQVLKRAFIESGSNVYKDYFDGNYFRFGVVSDTHLCSKEEALEELHSAYDEFENRGIKNVYHGGDLVCGIGIYPTQISDVKHYTFEEQVKYGTLNYPERNDIKTLVIAGNHDIEGSFGRMGANPVAAICNQRNDMINLGEFSSYVEIQPNVHIHLLHGRGGGGNPYLYTQKITNSYTNIKPIISIVGHYHTAGTWRMNDVEIIWPGCFEKRTNLMQRIHLLPSICAWVISGKVNDKGKLIEYVSERLNY